MPVVRHEAQVAASLATLFGRKGPNLAAKFASMPEKSSIARLAGGASGPEIQHSLDGIPQKYAVLRN
jgi:hypothetical protein